MIYQNGVVRVQKVLLEFKRQYLRCGRGGGRSDKNLLHLLLQQVIRIKSFSNFKSLDEVEKFFQSKYKDLPLRELYHIPFEEIKVIELINF